MKKLRMTALLLAMLAALAVNVNAAEEENAPAEEAVTETAPEAAVIAFPGKLPVTVTSSMSEPVTDTCVFFDKLADTGYDIVAGEEGGAYSLYTSVGVRDRVDLFAAKISGEHYTSIEVTVYASNDNAEWVQLNVSQPMEQNGFQVFYMPGDGERYTFYRFDFKMIMGDSFTLSELALFKDDLGEPEYIYVLGDTVEDGQLPELVPVTEEKETAPAQPHKNRLLPRILGFGF